MTPPTHRHIRTAQGLIEALTSPDMATRVKVLRAIVARPEQALAYGAYRGRDIVDTLIHFANQTQGSTGWQLFARTLAAFDDPRVAGFFRDVLASSADPEVIFLAAERLEQEPLGSQQAFLVPLLMQNESIARARAAADLLSESERLSAAEGVRVALLTDADESRIPPLDTETAAFWLEEMGGAFRVQARERLEEMGESAFLFLAQRWEALSEENREWLLEWGGRQWPGPTEALLTKALDSDSDRLARAALECIAARDEGPAGFGAALGRFVHHPDAALRLAAIRAGAMGVDWRAVIAWETEPVVRQACVHGLAREEGSRAVPTLVSLLQEGSWELRAAAVSALTKIGAAAIESVQPLIHHPRQEAQASAVQILLALGQESWLYEEMSL